MRSTDARTKSLIMITYFESSHNSSPVVTCNLNLHMDEHASSRREGKPVLSSIFNNWTGDMNYTGYTKCSAGMLYGITSTPPTA